MTTARGMAASRFGLAAAMSGLLLLAGCGGKQAADGPLPQDHFGRFRLLNGRNPSRIRTVEVKVAVAPKDPAGNYTWNDVTLNPPFVGPLEYQRHWAATDTGNIDPAYAVRARLQLEDEDEDETWLGWATVEFDAQVQVSDLWVEHDPEGKVTARVLYNRGQTYYYQFAQGP
jgi:hypothetical protein